VVFVEKTIGFVVDALQNVALRGEFTCALGSTVIVNDSLTPGQFTPLYCKTGVTVIVATIGESVDYLLQK
jgi:hypothetical protein